LGLEGLLLTGVGGRGEKNEVGMIKKTENCGDISGWQLLLLLLITFLMGAVYITGKTSAFYHHKEEN
jgi:hypothetical protein